MPAVGRYIGISIGSECSGTRPTCSHAVSVQLKDPAERSGTRWIDQGLMNGIEIFKLLARLPPDVAPDSREHFEQYRACRNDVTSVKQRYKKHRKRVTFAKDPPPIEPSGEKAAASSKEKKRDTAKTPRRASKKKEDDEDVDDEDEEEEEYDDAPTATEQRRVSPYDVGVLKDDEQVPKAYLRYSATRLNVKRKRRSPRTTVPPYTNDPLDPFADITVEDAVTALRENGVNPGCCGHANEHWEWDPELFACVVPTWRAVEFPLRIQNLVSKCVITGKEKLNPDDFRNACEGCMRRFPAHTVKLTTCSQTLFEEGQMNIAGRTDRFDELRWVYLTLFYLTRLTGKRYDVRNFGVVNIATSTDLKHKINLTAFRNYLLTRGYVAVYEPDNFPGSQWNFVPAGRQAEAYANALARAEEAAANGTGGGRGKKKRAKRKKTADETSSAASTTQKGPVVQAFSTGRATLVGVQSEFNTKVAEVKIIPFIAKFVRKLPSVVPLPKKAAVVAAAAPNLTRLL